MKKKCLFRVFLSFVLLFICLVSIVQAADLQSALVVDCANIFKSSFSEVEKAAQELQSLGVDIHVWTITSFSEEAGSLDEYFQKLLSRFPAWQSSDGNKKNNLIVFIVALKNRKTGLYYGGEWTGPLARNWVRVQTDFMNPRFKEGKFAEGFIAGIGEVRNLIYEHLHPKASSQTAPSQPIIIQQSEPTNFEGLWSILGWILGLLIVAALIVIGIRLLLHWRDQEGLRKEAQQRAKIEKNKISKTITEVKNSKKAVGELLAVLSGSLADEIIKFFRKKLDKVGELCEARSQDFLATSSSAGNPENDQLTKEQYQAIESKFSELAPSINSISSNLNSLNDELRKIRQAVQDVPILMDNLMSELKAAQNVFGKIQDKGFKTDSAEATLKEANELIKETQRLRNEKKILALKDNIEKARAKVSQARNEAENLPSIKENLDLGIKEIEQEGPEVMKIITEGRKAFSRIEVSFVSTSWDSIKGNGTEAENRLNKAAALLVEAKAKAGMDKQEWEGARERINEAKACLKKASSLMQSIFSLENNLNEAKEKVAAEVAEVEQDIQKAKSFIHRFDEDIQDSLEVDLHKAKQMVDAVKAELLKEMPDYIKAFKKAQKANALADRIYDQAVEEHEAAERARRRAEAEKQSAKAAISRAQEYLEDHESDVEHDAKERLRIAKRKFHEASNQRDLSRLIMLMDLSRREADWAYDSAKSNVAAAEEASRISWGSSDDSFSSSSSISIFGGGGSTSFGGGSFGGGGSTSFGGGSFGGGGSTSW